jgi:ArsR family transcriptional regulator
MPARSSHLVVTAATGRRVALCDQPLSFLLAAHDRPPYDASMAPASGNLQTFKAEFFRALAHPVRIRILEALVRGERTVGQLQRDLDLEQSLVSQQLAVLRAKNVVAPRKDGTTVYYTLRDPLLGDLLDVARMIFNRHLVGTQGLLRELQRQRKAR